MLSGLIQIIITPPTPLLKDGAALKPKRELCLDSDKKKHLTGPKRRVDIATIIQAITDLEPHW